MSQFIFNDYASSPNDPGVEYAWDLGDKGVVPIRIRKTLGIRERRKANEAATRLIFKPDGTPEVKGFDEGLWTLMVAQAVIVSWPFTDEQGKAIPVDQEHLAQLDSFALDALVEQYQKTKQQQVAAHDPFENKSEGAS